MNQFTFDISMRLRIRPRIIFDVGAHKGETALEFESAFPDAHIHCFEPDPVNYGRLIEKVPMADCYQVAVGARAGRARFKRGGASYLGRLDKDGEIEVDVIALDDGGITKIDILKIDTEGHEIQVLKGASELLLSGSIRVIIAECSPNPKALFHTPFHRLNNYLTKRGYRLFGIYNQNGGFNIPHLSFFDAAYVLQTKEST